MLLRNQDISKSPAVSPKVTGRLRTPRDGQKQVGIVIDSLPSHVTISSDNNRQGHHCLHFSLKNKPTVLQACYALVSSQQSVCALLDDGKRIKGLVTVADIVEKVLAQKLNPARILCATIMRKDLMTLVEGQDKSTLEMRAAEIMLRGSLDYLAVTDSQNRFLRTLFLGDLLSGPPANCKTRTSVTPKPYAQEPKTRRIPDFLKTKVEVLQHNLRFIVARGSTFGGDENSKVFPETTSLEETAIWMHKENVHACLVSSNGLFVLKDEALLKAVTLGFDLKRTLISEAVSLLSLPNAVSYTSSGRISARQALLLMRKYQDEYIVLVKKQTGVKCLVSRLDATRKELQKLQARRMLRKDLLRHVSFRPQASLPHLIRLPSGKMASLPLQPNMEIPLPSVRSRRQLEKAEECIARSEFNEALRNYTHYLQRNPQDSRAYMRRGILLQNQLQNQEEAINDFRTALSTNHLGEQEKREAHILLCIGCLELNQFQDAQRIWRQYALHRDEVVSHGVLKFAISSFQHLHEDALDVMSRTRSYEKALKIIETALQMNGFAQIASETVNVECPEATSEIRRKEAELLVTRARCKQRLALVDDALLDCRKALDLDQTNRLALQLLVETERACELELRVNEITRKMGVSNSAELFLDRARIEYEQGCYVQAMRDFRSAARADCTCWLESDEKAFVEVARESDELHDTLSCYIENNLLQKITKMLELCGQYAPGLDAAIFRFLEETVLLFRKRGMEAFSSLQFRPAMDQFTKAIAICEQFEPVKCNLKEECSHLYVTRAGCLMGFKEMQQAMEDCENAIVLNPMNEKAWTRKCSCLQSMDDHDGFVRTALEAKKLFGNSNNEIAELVARALAIVPLEAEETSFVTSDDVFAHM